MSTVSISKKDKCVKISDLVVKNPLIYQYFNKIKQKEYEEELMKALYIGVLALQEDRISAFFARTKNELGTELESLKMIFEMQANEFYHTTVKGMKAEEIIKDYLSKYLQERNLNDTVELTGTKKGRLDKNKTGDLECIVDGTNGKKIAIECKWDKSVKLGDIRGKEYATTNKTDTAWSQLLEASANRDAKVSIIVFDRTLLDESVKNTIDNVEYINGVGLVAIVDSQSNDYTNLFIAYMLARNIVVNAKNKKNYDSGLFVILVKRILKNLSDIQGIKKLVESNIDNNKKILTQIYLGLKEIEVDQKILENFLKNGTLTAEELLSYYQGDEVKEAYKAIQKEIEEKIN